jgi:hypothetical protein
MNLNLQILSLILGIFFLLVILYNIRRKKLSPSYSVLWIVLALFLILIPVFQSIFISIARFFGVYAENLIYILLIGFLLIYVLYITSKVVRLNNQVKELISNSAILEDELNQLKRKQ